jgi:ssDNA-binding Zn-finger/Zn-ribbon topoisomerase 1
MIFTCKKCGWQVGKYRKTVYVCEKCGGIMEEEK